MKYIEPVKDFIVLELPEDAESKVVLLEEAKQKVINGTSLKVVRTGPDCKTVKVGDSIVVDFKAAMMPVQFEGKQYFITKEDPNVCAVIRSEG